MEEAQVSNNAKAKTKENKGQNVSSITAAEKQLQVMVGDMHSEITKLAEIVLDLPKINKTSPTTKSFTKRIATLGRAYTKALQKRVILKQRAQRKEEKDLMRFVKHLQHGNVDLQKAMDLATKGASAEECLGAIKEGS